MPYKSKAQAAYMHINHPKIAKRWDMEYGSNRLKNVNKGPLKATPGSVKPPGIPEDEEDTKKKIKPYSRARTKLQVGTAQDLRRNSNKAPASFAASKYNTSSSRKNNTDATKQAIMRRLKRKRMQNGNQG